MSLRQKSVKEKGFSDVGCDGKVVVVAVKASIEISRTPLIWALTHVAQHGDCVKLLVVIPSNSSARKLWGFSRFTSECTNGPGRSYSGTNSDQKEDITDMCTQMMLQLQDVYDQDKIKVKVKIVPGSPYGVVAAEARRTQSNWVILDRRLKHEKKCCMEELQCNVVVMKRSRPKVLRLNLVVSPNIESEVYDRLSFELEASAEHPKSKFDLENMIRGPCVTPTSSPEQGTSLTATDAGTSSISSSDLGASPFILSEMYGDLKKEYSSISEKNWNFDDSNSDTDSEKLSLPSADLGFQSWFGDILSSGSHLSNLLKGGPQRPNGKKLISASEALLEKYLKFGKESEVGVLNYKLDLDSSRSLREVISLSRNAPSASPPLCSICQHKAPVFGKPPRAFTYTELELATGGFSEANFLAEGGFGSVHRGVLPDGQVVAVKQHKLASSQGDLEFCSEVEVLSCAQHRNVVMLIGFCVEAGRRLLVYEYICNRSLDSHLYGKNQPPLKWSARQKIAVGAARGLRYLHEECRVGCIVHRDMRPNNILLTHDFEPLVGDFGLARWQPDGDTGVETRVIGTFGYLAPEYAQSGEITEKTDVYSFGVVLVELITGRKAMDISRARGQQCLAEWARPLLKQCAVDELIDPRLENLYSEQEVYNMLHCASLCIRRDPHARPRMSQVLRMLEGDIVINSNNNMLTTSADNVGNNSSRMRPELQELQQQQARGPSPTN